MISLRQLVEDELQHQPDLLYWLEHDLLNVTSLARYMRPILQQKQGQIIGLETVSMTIRRIVKEGNLTAERSLHAPHAKNLQVQLDVIILTLKKDFNLSSVGKSDQFRFFSFAQGPVQSMLAVSQEEASDVVKHAIKIQKNMAALTVTLSNESSNTIGAYAYIVQILSLAGIPLAEVVTLHDDITILISEEYIDISFQILRKSLKA